VICTAVASTALLFSSSQADELIYSGFMTDYTQLEKITDGTADYRYIAADTMIGPLYLGYGVAEGGVDSFYLYVGALRNNAARR